MKKPELDPQSVSPETLRSFREFWAKLPPEESAALDSELDELEERAQKGDDLDDELARLRARYPELFQMAAALHSALWVTGGSRRSTRTLRCSGVLFVGRNGRVRCIGQLTT